MKKVLITGVEYIISMHFRMSEKEWENSPLFKDLDW